MAVGDAVGRWAGRRAVALLLALAATGGCSFGAAQDDGSAGATVASLEVPPPPANAAPPASGAASVPQTATRIEKVTIESAPPTTRVVLQLDGSAEPEVSLLVNQRLVIDVPDTTCATVPRVIEAPGDPLVERVRTGQHAPPESKSRVVVDLRRRADFSVRVQGDRIVAYLTPADGAPESADGSRILFGAESVADGGVPAPSPAPAAPPDPGPPFEPAPTFAPEPLPEALPTPAAEELAPEPTPLAIAPEPGPAPTPLAAVPEAEPVLATPVASEPTPEPYLVEATPSASPVAEPAPLPAEPAEPAPPPSDAIDDAATDAPITAPTPDPTPPLVPQAGETRAGGKRISIDFTEADVRTVIELIASAGGYKVLFTPEVGGTVTISVVDRPWEDALATVLRARRLREVRHEDVMLVSPAGR